MVKLIERSQTAEVLDVEDLIRRCMGNRDFAAKIIRAFLAQLEADLAELESAVAEENAALIQIIAHRVKGSSSNVSAHRIHQIADAVGELAKSHELDQIRHFSEMLRREQGEFIGASNQI